MFLYAQELKKDNFIVSSGVAAREQDIIESKCYKKKNGFNSDNRTDSV